MEVLTLKKRKDFVKAAKGFKVVTNGLVLQAALSFPAPTKECCFAGFTATKKLGKAHIRNATKRKLRAVVRLVLPQTALSGIDYVFIGRHNTTALEFTYLQKRVKNAILQINEQITAKREAYVKKVNDSSD